jgi:hypothetical protein
MYKSKKKIRNGSNITMATVINTFHKAQKPLTASDYQTMATVVTTHILKSSSS